MKANFSASQENANNYLFIFIFLEQHKSALSLKLELSRLLYKIPGLICAPAVGEVLTDWPSPWWSRPDVVEWWSSRAEGRPPDRYSTRSPSEPSRQNPTDLWLGVKNTCKRVTLISLYHVAQQCEKSIHPFRLWLQIYTEFNWSTILQRNKKGIKTEEESFANQSAPLTDCWNCRLSGKKKLTAIDFPGFVCRRSDWEGSPLVIIQYESGL